jgi:hypothetical protein
MAWSAYWVALALWGIGTALPTIWRLTRPESHGSTSLSFGNGAFHFIVLEGTTTVWRGDIGLQTLALLVAIPPLALWMLWLLAAHRRGQGAAANLEEGEAAERGVVGSTRVGEHSRRDPE